MKFLHWLKKELKDLAVLFLYFALYFGVFLVFKKLILAHYDVSFYGFGATMVGALIAAKAVLVIESIPLPKGLRSAAPIFTILYQTFVYTTLALVFLYLEKTLELIHREGTFRLAFFTARHEDDLYEFCAMVGWAGLTFLHYSALSAISRHLGPSGLLRMFLTAPRTTDTGRCAE